MRLFNFAIRAKVVVLYSHVVEEGTFREGNEFVEITNEDRSFLRHFIMEQLTFNIMPGSRLYIEIE